MITDELTYLIQQGYQSIGELEFTRLADSSSGDKYLLFHQEDRNHLRDARVYKKVTDAREIAKYDRYGNYRPLKGAPNLPRGWVLELPDIDSLRRALDLFYPGAVGTFLAFKRNATRAIAFRDTVNRQTGMYRVTKKITTAEAERLVSSECCSEYKCLRTILWSIEPDGRQDFLPKSKSDPDYDQTGAGRIGLPFLCLEPCNLLVAAARRAVTKSQK